MAVEFPEEYKKDFNGLVFFGQLIDSFTYGGHDFVIKTLNNQELYNAALVSRRFVGTKAERASYAAGIVAMALVSIDGKEFVLQLGPDNDTAQRRYDIITEWYPLVIDYVFEKYIELESQAKKVADSLGES